VTIIPFVEARLQIAHLCRHLCRRIGDVVPRTSLEDTSTVEEGTVPPRSSTECLEPLRDLVGIWFVFSGLHVLHFVEATEGLLVTSADLPRTIDDAQEVERDLVLEFFWDVDSAAQQV